MRGREGDIIDGRYRLVRIGVESVVMEYLDGRGRTTIRLSGQECVSEVRPGRVGRSDGVPVLKHRLVVVIVLALLVVGVRGRHAPSARGRTRRGPATGTRRSPTTRRRSRRTRTRRSTRSRSSAPCRRPRASTSAARASSKQKDQLDAALLEYKTRARARPDQPARGLRASVGAREDDSRSHRGVASEAADRRAARAGARAARRRCSTRPSREPVRSASANASLRDILNFIGTATGINVTYDQQFAGQGLHRQPRRRDARAGAAADHVGQPALLQGPQPEDDHRRPRQRRRSTRSTTSWSSGSSTSRTPT